MSISRNFKLIMGALICLLLSISAMLGIYLFYNHEKTNLTFTLPNKLDLYVGQTTSIVYETNMPEAKFSFIVADPQIASITENNITALKEGTTILRATASFDGQVCYASSTITVTSNPAPTPSNYNFSIEPENNCTYDNGILFLISEMASFKLVITDINNQIYDYSSVNVKIDCSENINITKEIEYFIISASNEGFIKFDIDEIGLVFSIPIKISQKIDKNG